MQNDILLEKSWMMIHNCLLFFQHLMSKNLVVQRKPFYKIGLLPNICSKVLGNWKWKMVKMQQQGSQLFQFWSLSLQSVKHHISVLLKYEFYIKVDEKTHKVAILLCRIVLWSSESECEIFFRVWHTWERGLLCRITWESS